MISNYLLDIIEICELPKLFSLSINAKLYVGINISH